MDGWQDKQNEREDPMSQSAIIDMQDEGNHGYGYDQDESSSRKRTGAQKSPYDEMKEGIAKNVTSMLWASGKQQAEQAWTSYARIDILRPYFDVEPIEVVRRLMQSFVPKKPIQGVHEKLHTELYGPTMITFTLVAILLFEMKTSNHKPVGEGTLMSSALFGVLIYWLGGSALIWSVGFVCNTAIKGMEILSLLGYAMSSYCVVIFLGTVLHTSHSHLLFYACWAIFGGLTTLKMVLIFVSRTSGKTQQIVICSLVASLHLLFLIYFHFAYHYVVEGISHVENSLEKSLIGEEKAASFLANKERAVHTFSTPMIRMATKSGKVIMSVLTNRNIH